MRKTNKLIILTIILFIILILMLIVNSSIFSQPRVCIKNSCFNVELAKTPQERAAGLMHRQPLPVDKGMLFIFPNEDIYSFWMKNTLIPLDIIWISSDNKIVHIEEVPPCNSDPCDSYSPDKRALYVLEINAGLSQKYNLKISDNVEIDI